MNLSSVLTFARTQAQTDANGLTDTNGLIFANEANADFHRRLIDKGIDASQTYEASINGVAGTGVYSYPRNPASVIALKAIELNYTNTVQRDYKVASQVDISNLPAGGFSVLRVDASPFSPYFDDRGDKFEIFPTPTDNHDLTALIRLVGFVQPSVFTAVNNEVNYPEGMDTAILGWRIAALYLYSIGDMEKGKEFEAKYEERVRQYISTLGRGAQQPIEATTIRLSGFEY